jgi:hypothetical protein
MEQRHREANQFSEYEDGEWKSRRNRELEELSK